MNVRTICFLSVILSVLVLGILTPSFASNSQIISREEAIISAWKEMIHANIITCAYNESENVYYVKVCWVFPKSGGGYKEVPEIPVTRTGTVTYVVNATNGEIIRKIWSFEVKKEVTKDEAVEKAYCRFPKLKITSINEETWNGKPVWKINGVEKEHHYWFVFHWTTDRNVEILIDKETGKILHTVRG